MIRGLERLTSMRYPGRGIILGRDLSGLRRVVVYFVTGRSASSQARRLTWEDSTLWTKPTDEKTLSTGAVELLIYPAVMLGPAGLAVSNGRQTEDIARTLRPGARARGALGEALKSWTYEPDAPIYTPRISGCLGPGEGSGLAILSRTPNGGEARRFYALPAFKKGRGLLLTTYSGPDRRLVPAFTGAPRPVRLRRRTAQEMAEAVYSALGPSHGRKDYRVAVACLFVGPGDGRPVEVKVINRSERMGAGHGQG
jgi:IMP cyclohydrolase